MQNTGSPLGYKYKTEECSLICCQLRRDSPPSYKHNTWRFYPPVIKIHAATRAPKQPACGRSHSVEIAVRPSINNRTYSITVVVFFTVKIIMAPLPQCVSMCLVRIRRSRLAEEQSGQGVENQIPELRNRLGLDYGATE